MKIAMGVVNSDAIKAIGFSGAKGRNGVLRIQFADGEFFEYRNVDYQTYRRFVLSPSKGEFYNNYIRGQFSE